MKAHVAPSLDQEFHPVLFAAALSPWLCLIVYVALRVRVPRPLPTGTSPALDSAAPLISIIVPARNEARNIQACLKALAASAYPNFEIIVVDDRSEDDTADMARAVPKGNAGRIQVLPGKPLPQGWFGKPWACQQGAAASRGSILLFTDADTLHGPGLLGRAVRSMREDRADAVSLVGRQIMATFWERLIQPQFFVLLALRYPDHRQPLSGDRWRNALANGQFILVRRDTYDAVGGHECVAGEVVEDLRLAQELVRAGHRLTIRGAEDAFATRMYHSLAEIVAGWGKNLYTASRQATPAWATALVLPLAVLAGALLWLIPPFVGLVWWAGWAPALESWPAATGAWSISAMAISLLFWMTATVRLGAPAAYGVLYPLGAVVAGFILLRSWGRGSRIQWKGRTYTVVNAESGTASHD